MHKYPFYGRMILFLCPALILFVGSGFEYLKVHALNKRPLIIWTLFVLILVHPLAKSIFLTLRPIEREEIKPAIEYLKSHRKHGDKLYVYFAAGHAFRYYRQRFQIENGFAIIGAPLIDYSTFERVDDNGYKSEMDRLSQYTRAWILFSHVYDNDERLFTEYLNISGTQRDVFKAVGVSMYLYEFDS